MDEHATDQGRSPAGPRVGIVLGAGGSVGHAFHLGVLSGLLDELGWDVRNADVIIGTSAGSVVGAGLRAGIGPADMRARALDRPLSEAGQRLVRRGDAALAEAQARTDAASAADDPTSTARRRVMASPERVMKAIREPWRVTPGSLLSAMIPAGRTSNDYLGAPFDAYFGASWPTETLWVVAVKLDHGDRVVFGRDAGRDSQDGGAGVTVGQAVQASCAVPGLFAPVIVDGERYVDGGVHSTTNADLAGGCDLVVVSAPMSPERAGVELSARQAVREFARRAVAAETAALRAGGAEVVTFQPDAGALALMSGNSMDPAKAPAIVAHVSEWTRRALHDPERADALSRLSP